MMKEKRLSKALAHAGIASRRACEEIIFAGRVKVNGATVRVPQTLVDWDRDTITVDEALVKCEEKKLYFMLNKPSGYICSSVRPQNKRIVLDLLPEYTERLFTVGRLDKDTKGLIIITNDGHFANAIIHPRANISKEYLVKVMQEVTPEHLYTMSEGARIDGRWIRPLSVNKVRRGTFKICVKEGKKHEVRLLAERAKLEIVELTRIRIGHMTLGSLKEGAFKALSEAEKERLCLPDVYRS